MDILLANGCSREHCERKLHCLTQENFTCYHYVKYVLLKLHSTLHRTVLFVIWLFVLQVKAYSFWIFPIHRCVLAPFTQYFPPRVLGKKYHRDVTRVGFEPWPLQLKACYKLYSALFFCFPIILMCKFKQIFWNKVLPLRRKI